MSRVIVAGSISMDITAIVDRYPKVGQQVYGKDLGFFIGGKGANQAIACAKLGVKSLLVGKVGEDKFGDDLEKFIKNQGVEVNLGRTSKTHTGTTLITVEEKGLNTMVVLAGANLLFSPNDLSGLKIEKEDVLLSMLEIPDATVEKFFHEGNKVGARTILTAAPCRPCQKGILESSDVIVMNENEFAFHTGKDNATDAIPENARSMMTRPTQAIIITLGPKGAVCVTKEKEFKVAGRRVKAVDTTGAGDCFVGALAARIAQGRTVEESMEYANAAASISVQRMGAGNSMPTREEVENVLKKI